VTFLHPQIYQNMTFYHFLGRLINLTPLGKGFDYFFPIFILFPVAATLFNLYGKVKSLFGFGILEDDAEENPTGFGTGGWREGRELIERELHDSGSSALGLSTRTDPHGRAATNGIAGSRQTRPSERRERRAAPAVPENEGGEEGFFEGFAHRVRNTLDTTDRPRWMSNLGEGIKRPRWMGGNAEDSGRGGYGGGLGRWFGGRPEEGHVRL